MAPLVAATAGLALVRTKSTLLSQVSMPMDCDPDPALPLPVLELPTDSSTHTSLGEPPLVNPSTATEAAPTPLVTALVDPPPRKWSEISLPPPAQPSVVLTSDTLDEANAENGPSRPPAKDPFAFSPPPPPPLLPTGTGTAITTAARPSPRLLLLKRRAANASDKEDEPVTASVLGVPPSPPIVGLEPEPDLVSKPPPRKRARLSKSSTASAGSRRAEPPVASLPSTPPSTPGLVAIGDSDTENNGRRDISTVNSSGSSNSTSRLRRAVARNSKASSALGDPLALQLSDREFFARMNASKYDFYFSLSSIPSLDRPAMLSRIRSLAATLKTTGIRLGVIDGDDMVEAAAVTHVIARVDENLCAKRSQKYIAACIYGQWVVRPEWINACCQSKSLVPEAPFEVEGNMMCGPTGGVRKNREQRAAKVPSVLAGLSIYLQPALPPTPLEDSLPLITSDPIAPAATSGAPAALTAVDVHDDLLAFLHTHLPHLGCSVTLLPVYRDPADLVRRPLVRRSSISSAPSSDMYIPPQATASAALPSVPPTQHRRVSGPAAMSATRKHAASSRHPSLPKMTKHNRAPDAYLQRTHGAVKLTGLDPTRPLVVVRPSAVPGAGDDGDELPRADQQRLRRLAGWQVVPVSVLLRSICEAEALDEIELAPAEIACLKYIDPRWDRVLSSAARPNGGGGVGGGNSSELSDPPPLPPPPTDDRPRRSKQTKQRA
ncbi:hypothetical protein BC828DRAFT_394080 [Blastocladiella britannica]|nr:hypothetical protein BC828DRAFT_394080 [Blastocladiella britannica]